MQCAFGQAPHKLLKTEGGLKTGYFAECHGSMSVAVEDDTDILIVQHDKLNGAGLFIASVKMFCFLDKLSKDVRDIIIDHVLNDEDVQFDWGLMSKAVDSEEDFWVRLHTCEFQ